MFLNRFYIILTVNYITIITLTQQQNVNIKCGLSKSMAIKNNKCKRIVNYEDTDQISDRIVGGMAATIDQIPWMASLYVNNRGHCGATVDERWILTAAHCLHPNVNTNDIIVRIGSNNKLNGRPLGVKEAHIHPKYITNGYLINDMALIELKTSIKYDMSYANRVCLPINAALSDRYPMLTMFSGWGQISTDGKQPTNTLMKTDYYTIPNHLCKYKSKYFICVNGSQSMGCSGDSGSPLVVYQGCNAVLMGSVARNILTFPVKCDNSAQISWIFLDFRFLLTVKIVLLLFLLNFVIK